MHSSQLPIILALGKLRSEDQEFNIVKFKLAWLRSSEEGVTLGAEEEGEGEREGKEKRKEKSVV